MLHCIKSSWQTAGDELRLNDGMRCWWSRCARLLRMWSYIFSLSKLEFFSPLMNKSLKTWPNWPQLSKSFSFTVSPKSCSGGQHGYCSVMLRKYERACGMAGSVDRWLVQLRHTRRSPSRKDESPFCQLFLSAQNLTLTRCFHGHRNVILWELNGLPVKWQTKPQSRAAGLYFILISSDLIGN